jgi:FkbM family methyltransferase
VTDPRETTGIGIWLHQTLRVGDVVFDVGANVGVYTGLAAAAVGSTGHVYAFEPGPDNVSDLHKGFETTTNVTVIAAAVSDRPGTTTLFMDRSDPRRHSLAGANVGKAGRTIAVPQVCLDDYCATLTRLDVIKVDAQGAELAILHGAQRAIDKFKPKLILELWPAGLRNLGTTADQLLAEVGALGYDIYRLSADGVLKDTRHISAVLQTTERWKNINVVGISKTSPPTCSGE